MLRTNCHCRGYIQKVYVQVRHGFWCVDVLIYSCIHYYDHITVIVVVNIINIIVLFVSCIATVIDDESEICFSVYMLILICSSVRREKKLAT